MGVLYGGIGLFLGGLGGLGRFVLSGLNSLRRLVFGRLHRLGGLVLGVLKGFWALSLAAASFCRASSMFPEGLIFGGDQFVLGVGEGLFGFVEDGGDFFGGVLDLGAPGAFLLVADVAEVGVMGVSDDDDAEGEDSLGNRRDF